MTIISANSILPARRDRFETTTADGLRLVGEVAAPEHGEPVATLVCVHPLPTDGGSSDSHLLRKLAWRLPALAGIAVVRFNTRGTSSSLGTSQGAYDQARGEGLDLAAVLGETARRGLPDPWLVGWSFGTDVVLRHGDRDPVQAAVLLSPPLRWSGPQVLARWAQSGRPLHVLVPQFDDFLRPPEARQRFAAVPQAQVVEVPGAGHLWVGERYVRIVLDSIVGLIAPAYAPLPQTWSGPMQMWRP